jgi:hypothetical protein
MPSHGLKSGDVGAVVQYSTDAIEVEFVTASGHTQALMARPVITGLASRHQ